MDLKYTISKFDIQKRVVTVTFENDGWAEIRLTNPLPQNIGELERIIKQYTAPLEAVESPDADLSYINALVGNEQTTTRLSLKKENGSSSNQPLELDPEVEANMRMWETIEFEKKVGAALVKLGVVSENPAVIPVTNI
jgi:hypothetical protein